MNNYKKKINRKYDNFIKKNKNYFDNVNHFFETF